MKNKNNILYYYGDILSKSEIVSMGIIIRKFENGQISYKTLKILLQKQGIMLKPRLNDFSTKDLTRKTADKLKIRLFNENFLPSDLSGYIILNENYQNVIVWYDKFMMECLAEYGDKVAQKTLESLVQKEEEFKPCII